MSETTTDELETLKQNPEQDAILKAIADLGKSLNERIDRQDLQLEAIREGIAHNASRFDRVDANIYSVRSDISNLKADVRDLREEVRQKSIKTLV